MKANEANKIGKKVVEQFDKMGIHATAEVVLDTIAFIGDLVEISQAVFCPKCTYYVGSFFPDKDGE